MEMLENSGLSSIFDGAPIEDVNEIIAKGELLPALGETSVFYHDPCHSPLKKSDIPKLVRRLTGADPMMAPRCCGEGGTLSLSTPHIAGTIRDRKADIIGGLGGGAHAAAQEVLTTCPSCVQGLSKLHGKVTVTGKSLVVHLAEKHLGRKWRKDFIKRIKRNKGTVDRTLL
jgi:Fe-S oxidoreductase